MVGLSIVHEGVHALRVLVATRSGHKLREIRTILREISGMELLSPDEVGISWSSEEESIEIHSSFEENAQAKARWFHAKSGGLPILADDSGLEVDALEGRPGVHSKRFAPGRDGLTGEELDHANNGHLLDLLGDLPLPERTGRYVCVAVLHCGPADEVVIRGTAEGLLLDRPRGRGGFGYDPLFLDPRLGRSFAELAPDEKAGRSHRGKAFRALIGHLSQKAG